MSADDLERLEAAYDDMRKRAVVDLAKALQDRASAHLRASAALAEKTIAEQSLANVRQARLAIAASPSPLKKPRKHALVNFTESRGGARAGAGDLFPDEFESMRLVQRSCEVELGLATRVPEPSRPIVDRSFVIPAARPCFDQETARPFVRGMSRVWARRLADQAKREGTMLDAVIICFKGLGERGKPLTCAMCSEIIQQEFYACVHETSPRFHVACAWFAMASESLGCAGTASVRAEAGGPQSRAV